MIKLGRTRYVDLSFKKDFSKAGMGKNSVMPSNRPGATRKKTQVLREELCIINEL